MFSPLWLDYGIGKSNRQLGKLFCLETSNILRNALAELRLAFECDVPDAPDVYLLLDSSGEEEHYEIRYENNTIEMLSACERGLFYASSKLIQLARLGKLAPGLMLKEGPATALRMIDHWDNLDGTIERGYAGQSFFFKDHEIIIDERTTYYARTLASIGINAICFNNVNVVKTATELITDRYFSDLNKLFSVFASYGVAPYLSLNYASPIELGGLETADPLDADVIAWWDKKMAEVFRNLPSLGGFVVKADSEGRPGPFTYGRNQAEGANLLGRALQKYDGKLIWRAFVYNCRQDWRDRTTDRARAAYDYFAPLDGKFEKNVYLQIKNGPMDFQVREPVSPLFYAMDQTNLILELQIAQEYTGQQIDLCYLVPMWKEILEFPAKPLSDYNVRERIYRPNAGIAAVANTGNDYNWCGHYLAQANLYGFGRLAWNPTLTAEEILDEWLAQSFNLTDEGARTIKEMQLGSWQTMENYTAPLGIGWMVTPHYHYAPNIDGYEYSLWGTYHRADHEGIGIDRTKSGTGYASLYPSEVHALYEDIETCPDNLLLFFHHVPYTHVLQSGKTVIQHIYDTHFTGLAEVRALRERWESLKPEMAAEVYEHVARRLDRQVLNAREWCDQINTYFYRKSGIADQHERVIYS